ncbi:MAG: aconitate hydratase AcnA [Burkholderiales bacterium]
MGESREGFGRARGMTSGFDPAAAFANLAAHGEKYGYYSLAQAEGRGLSGVARLPRTLKVVLENLLRHAATGNRDADDIQTLMSWLDGIRGERHVRFRPARVMMDDTAGLPLIGDLAAMRDAAQRLGGPASCIDVTLPLDFIVDHSVIADHTGTPDALERNMALEMQRNAERFRLLRWAEHAFPKLRVAPPGRGICHQINLEYLATVVRNASVGGTRIAYPDTLIGIDSHTPMINALGVVGWGASGIEGLAAAMGEPISFALPVVVGCRLTGTLRPGITATDLVLTITRKLREHGVVGKVIEYFGPGVASLRVEDRATVANMTPEAGATMSYFPIDSATLRYLTATGRPPGLVALVETYARTQGLWADAEVESPQYDETATVDLSAIEPSVSGPRLPHQRVALSAAPAAFRDTNAPVAQRAHGDTLQDGDIVIAAITSCTNTSNPALMIGAGLLARNAVRRGLRVKPRVRTSLSPGSRVVADYLERSGLQASLDALGFHVTGFGCMSCVGFSGPLPADVVDAVRVRGVRAVAVFSGNRNYEGRAHPLVRSTFLASPPLVVAFALSGTVLSDLANEPLAEDDRGRPVFLSEIWPDANEVEKILGSVIDAASFTRSYSDVFTGSAQWNALGFQRGPQFAWEAGSTFIQRPRAFSDVSRDPLPLEDIRGARVLGIYGDMVTTEHISPMGPIPESSPAADYLRSLGVAPPDFVSYAARRLNHEVMARGTFSSPHLKNALAPDAPGGMTRHMPDGAMMTIHDASERYRWEGVPLIVIAGHAFGAGSSRDWSAKGPTALGVQAIIAESYERIYRSNLVAAGVLPLQFEGPSCELALDGSEKIDVIGVAAGLAPRASLTARFTRASGDSFSVRLIACVESAEEVDHLRHGGLLLNVLRRAACGARP